MISVATVLCMCVVQYSCGWTNYDGHKRIMADSGRLLGFDAGDEVANNSGRGWFDDVVQRTGSIAQQVLGPPLRGLDAVVNTTDFVAQAGEQLVSSIVKGAGNGLQDGWKAVQTFEAPGKKFIMVFPNAIVTVGDIVSQKVWVIASATGRSILAAEAWTIYTVLNGISTIMGPAIRALHMDCVKMRHMKNKIGKFVIDKMEVKDAKICGVSTLTALNKVNITQEDASFMVVTVPYIIKYLQVDIRAVNVWDHYGYLLKNTPMKVNIKNTYVTAKVFFTRGTLLKFMTIEFRVKKFGKFDLKIPVKDKDRTNVMDIVEGISDILAREVVKNINSKLKKLEKKISKILTGKR